MLLGSATPSVESMYRAKTGAYSLYTMAERYGGRKLPAVDIVDMREELKLGNDLSLSIPLREALSDNRDAGKQTILLLNRRETAGRWCVWTAGKRRNVPGAASA